MLSDFGFLHSVIFIDWMYWDRRGPEIPGLSVRCLYVCVSVCLCVCVSACLCVSVCLYEYGKLWRCVCSWRCTSEEKKFLALASAFIFNPLGHTVLSVDSNCLNRVEICRDQHTCKFFINLNKSIKSTLRVRVFPETGQFTLFYCEKKKIQFTLFRV